MWRKSSKAAVSPDDLRLEVTESSLMSNADAALETMQDLQTLGIGLHMDDFGAGYSSLNHLHRYPFDTLKIDRSFIQGIAEEKDSAGSYGRSSTWRGRSKWTWSPKVLRRSSRWSG